MLKYFKSFINCLVIVLPIIDPADAFFHVPIFFFLFVILVNIKDFDGRNIYYMLLFIGVYLISDVYMMTCPPPLGFDELINKGIIAKHIVYLPLLCLLTKDKNIPKYFFLGLYVIAIIEIVVFILYVYTPLSHSVWHYFHFKAKDTIMIAWRKILGINLAAVYYKSSALLIIAAAHNIVNLCNHKEFKRNFIGLFIIGIAFFCGGTRACMLGYLLLIYFSYCYYLLKKHKYVLLSLFFSILSCFFIVLVFKMLSEIGESSLNIKMGHLRGIKEQIWSDPLRSLFFGFGPGSLFYSYGTYSLRSITELTYWDIFRQYGIINGIFMISSLLLPVLSCLFGGKNKKTERFIFGLSFLAYYFIAGTNPLLFSSTGFLAILMMLIITQKLNKTQRNKYDKCLYTNL